MNILITGAAGYVGGMLADQFSKRDDISKIVAIDKDPIPNLLQGNEKIVYLQTNTSTDEWQNTAREYNPVVVINCAWQIREMYGKQKIQWQWNVEGANQVYDFVFATPSVERFIHFSTVSSYGAYPTNTLDFISEEQPFKESHYLYGIEKRVAEENLKDRYTQTKIQGRVPQVFIIRPQAITGPRGRFMFERFGLMAALQGNKNSAIPGFVKKMVSVIPVTHRFWSRQFIHEDDVCDIVELFTCTEGLTGDYEAFNVGTDTYVDAQIMARITGKKIVRIPAQLARMIYFILWHGTKGRVPTAHGGWRFYTYPVVVSGEKLTRMHGYQYRCTGPEALEFTNGRYESFVPEDKRNHNDRLPF